MAQERKFFTVEWSILYGPSDFERFKCLVIANSKEDAENKIRSVKGFNGALKIVECNVEDGIIFLDTN